MRTIGGVLLALTIMSVAQSQQRWTKTFGGAHDDYGNSVQQTTDGGYIIAGGSYSFSDSTNGDVYLIKTNASGDTQWTRIYGGRHADYGNSVEQTSDGGYVIAGYTYSFRDTMDGDVYLIKTNSSGDTLWTRTYGGSGADAGNSVQQTADRGYIVTGYTSSGGAGSNDVYLIKTDSLGDTLWTRTYGGAMDELGNSVRQTPSGGYVIAGWTRSFGVGVQSIYVIATNASGDTLWTRAFGGAPGFTSIGACVQPTSDSGEVVAGTTNAFGAGGYDIYLIKIKGSGETLWTRTYGGRYTDGGYYVQQTLDGGYVIAGYTYSFGSGNDDVYLVRTNSSGDTLWTRTYGRTGYDEGWSAEQTLDGGEVVAGYTKSFGAGGADVYLIKTDANGSLGVEEPVSNEQRAASRMAAAPNPFASITRMPGHEAERFEVYDAAGKMVGMYRGDRIGEGLSPAVYFIKPCYEPGRSLRVVKAR